MSDQVSKFDWPLLSADTLAADVFNDDSLMQAGAVVVQDGHDYRLVLTQQLVEKAVRDRHMAMSFRLSDVVGLRMSELSRDMAEAVGFDFAHPHEEAFQTLCKQLATPLLVVPELAGSPTTWPLGIGELRWATGFVGADFQLARRVYRCSEDPSETYDESEYRVLNGLCPTHPPDGRLL